MSRRLKHLNEKHVFFIKTIGAPNTETLIRSLVDDHILIYQKYTNKGHTKDTEIKKIDKVVELKQQDNGLIVKLSIHVHHYTSLYFSLYDYIAKLNSELKLPPASIKHTLVENENPVVEKSVVKKLNKDDSNSMFI
jgi:hypothetical protein